MNKERLNTFDIAKGIGIILVVVGHTATHIGLEKVIYQFHMPLFFILSGVFFKEINMQFPQAFMINKLRSLYIPYVLNGLRLFFVFLGISCLVLEDAGWSFLGGLKYMVLIICGIGSSPLGGTFWFLRALFIVCLLFSVLNWQINKIKTNYNKSFILFGFVFSFLIMGYYTNLPYNISSSFVALFFYYIGYLYAKNKEEIKMKWSYFITAFICVIGFSFINKVDMAYNTYTYFLLFILTSICGSYTILFVSEKVNRNSILEYIGKKSLSIMMFHFLSFVIINLVIVLLYALPIDRILDYPTIKEYRWWWLLYSVVGVIIPLFIDKIIFDFERVLPQYFTITFWLKKIEY